MEGPHRRHDRDTSPARAEPGDRATQVAHRADDGREALGRCGSGWGHAWSAPRRTDMRTRPPRRRALRRLCSNSHEGCRALRERLTQYIPAPVRAPTPFPSTADTRVTLTVMSEPADRTAALEAYHRDEVVGCTRCPLSEGRTQVVVGNGDPTSDLMFVGEAPGYHEDRLGVPFVGASGKLLTTLLEGIGLRREDVFVANVLKCRPPGQPRSAAGRDRGLRVAPVHPDRAHPAHGDLHPRQLRHQAPVGAPGRHLAGPRPPPRHRGGRRPGGALPALPPGRGPLCARDARDAGGGLRAHPGSPGGAAARPRRPPPSAVPSPAAGRGRRRRLAIPSSGCSERGAAHLGERRAGGHRGARRARWPPSCGRATWCCCAATSGRGRPPWSARSPVPWGSPGR